MFQQILNVFGLLLGQRGVTIILRLIQVKVATAILGPSGMGIWSQITTLLDTLKQVTLLGMGPGLVKLVAEADGNNCRNKIPSLLMTALSCMLVVILLAGICVFLFSSNLANCFLGSYDHSLYIQIAYTAGVCLAGSQLLLLLLQGLKNWQTLVATTILSALVTSSSIVICLYIGGLAIAIWGILIGAFLSLVFTVLLSAPSLIKKFQGTYFSVKPAWSHLSSLAEVAGIMSFVQIGGAFCIITLRSTLLNSSGASEAGYFHVSWVATEMLFGTISSVIWAHGMPSIASKKNDSEYVLEVQNNAIFLVLIVLSPLSVILLTTTNTWVPLITSSEFIEIGPVLGCLFLGKFFEALRQCLNTRLIPFRKYRFYIFQFVLLWGSVVILFLTLVSTSGALALAIGFLVAHALTTIAAVVYHTLVFHQRFEQRVIKMFLFSSIALLAATVNIIFLDSAYSYACWLLLIPCFRIAFTDQDIQNALTSLLSKFSILKSSE